MREFLSENAFGLGLTAALGVLWAVHTAATDDPEVTEDAADAIAVGAAAGTFTLVFGLLHILKQGIEK